MPDSDERDEAAESVKLRQAEIGALLGFPAEKWKAMNRQQRRAAMREGLRKASRGPV